LGGRDGVEIVRNLVQNLIIIVVLAVFLEMLLPASDMQRYLKMVMGLLIIVVVLQAVGGVVRGEWQHDLPEPALTGTPAGVRDLTDIVAAGQRIKNGQQQKALEEYRQGLSRQISALAGLNKDVQVVKVQVDVYDDPADKRFGQIREIELLMAAASPEARGRGGKRDESLVDPVTIDIGSRGLDGNKAVKTEPEAKKAAEQLVKTVANFYNLSPEQVKVHWVSPS
ncbi:stage III sporulation protein AF, partial [Desulfofundulus sp.]|uniref:stage III sporulation protein AF n=1 Tax=Desulfofundulus sp. TaxID=2282750 RepID=UPI003C785CA2